MSKGSGIPDHGSERGKALEGVGEAIYVRTDLACESPLSARAEMSEQVEAGVAPVTITRRLEADGAHSVTLSFGSFTSRGEGDIPILSSLLAKELRRMAAALLGRETDGDCRVLVVGLGNRHMTPDAIGPEVIRRLTVTRHLKEFHPALFADLGCCEIAALSPGVLGETGMESGELVRCAVELIHPNLVVAVDALAARSVERLSATVQISDGGIAPGAGIGNRRMALDRETLGCPVMSLGVPTVVDSSTLVCDALAQAGMREEAWPDSLGDVLARGRSFIVSPKDCDEAVELAARILARGLDEAFGVGE